MHRLILIVVLISSTLSHASSHTFEGLQALIAEEKFALAIKTGEQLLEQKSLWPDVQFLTAYAYQMNKQSKKAATMYQTLIAQHPELPEPRNNLAMIHLATGDYDAASKLLVEAISTHKSYATAYQNLSRIYTGIASEAYRRALSESKEPIKYTHKIELAALSQLEPVSQSPDVTLSVEAPAVEAQAIEEIEPLESLFRKQIKAWAKAWGDKDFSTYTSFYSTNHQNDFDTHSAWVEYRRQRIMRPGFIKIAVSDFRIRAQSDKRAIIDFKQAFESPGYSDRVVKRLGFKRVGSEWKIIEERVLSIL
jgi:tetratricopeptide (TPR) repeat protein